MGWVGVHWGAAGRERVGPDEAEQSGMGWGKVGLDRVG